MKRLFIDYLDVAPTRNWVDIQAHLNSKLFLAGREHRVEQRVPSFKLWQRSDPAKYKFFATDQALHIGHFDRNGEYGRSINLDKCVEMLHSQNDLLQTFISFGTILDTPFDKTQTLERARFYGRNFNDDSIIDLETGLVVASDQSIDFFSYFVLLKIKGIKDTYYLIANSEMIEMPDTVNTVINNDWLVRTLEKHDIGLREFIIQPSYRDCVKISHEIISPKSDRFLVDPYGTSRAVKYPQQEYGTTLLTRDDIQLKVRSSMSWEKQDDYYAFKRDQTKVNWIQFKIPANAYFDHQHVNLSLQKTIVVV
jgi:hypothetical protein